MCPIIPVGAFQIESYALFTYLGVFVGAWYVYHRLVHTERIDRYNVVIMLIFAFFAQMIGGQVIPFIWRWYRRGTFPQDLLLGGAGRYFHSALFSLIAFTLVYCKIKKWSTKRVLDYLAISVGLSSPIGRIGCFLTGCCAGKPANLPWAVKFPNKPFLVHPTQLYHFGVELFILFPLLLWIDKKRRYDGQTFWAFIFLYSIFRFWIEYLRTNPIAWLSLTHAQLFSAGAILVSGLVLAKQYHERPFKQI